ncbi:MAG: hypothetical protein V2A76_17605 [Planctomycetota bacterium]
MRPLLALLAGFSALGAEIVFTRRSELLLGNTGMIVAAVLCSHLLGLTFGAFRARRSRALSSRPYRMFGLAQIAQAFLIFLVDLLLPLLPDATTSGLCVRLPATMLLLFLPAVAAGFSFPALVALYGGGRAGSAYSLETLGAVIGSLVSGFILYRLAGLGRTAEMLAFAALLNGLLALTRSGWPGVLPLETTLEPERGRAGGRRMLLGLAVVGGAVLGMELLYTRLLLFFVPGLVGALSAVLAGILLGTSLGAAVGGMLARRGGGGRAAAWCLLCGSLGVWSSLVVLPHLAGGMRLLPRPLGGGYESGMELLTSFGLAVLLALPATAGAGAVLPLVIRALKSTPAETAGRAYGWSSLGSAAGVLVVAFSAGQWISLRAAVVGCGLALVLSALLVVEKGGRPRVLGFAALAAAALLLLSPRSEPLLQHSVEFRKSTAVGRTVLTTAEDRHLVASVVDLGAGRGRALYTNAFLAACTGPLYGYMRMLGHLPALLARSPEEVLVIAYGTGTTVGSVAVHPEVRSIDVAEISSAVMGLASWFDGANRGVPHRTDLGKKVDVHLGDGRAFLQGTNRRFDAITLEPLPPNTPAAVHFYTTEFYRACLSRLKSGGVLCQWIPLNSVPPDGFKILLRTFAAELPGTWLFLFDQSALLIGLPEARRGIDVAEVSRRAANSTVSSDLRQANMEGVAPILASFVTDREGLLRATAGAPIMSDDRPLVALELARPDRLALENSAENARFLSGIRREIGGLLDLSRMEVEEREEFKSALRKSSGSKRLLLEARCDPVRRIELWSRALSLSPGDLEAAARLTGAGVSVPQLQAAPPTMDPGEIRRILDMGISGAESPDRAIEAAGTEKRIDPRLLLPFLDHGELQVRLLAMVALSRRIGDVSPYDPEEDSAARRTAIEAIRSRIP